MNDERPHEEESETARRIDERMREAAPEKLRDEDLEERRKRDDEGREPGLDAV